MMRFRFRGALVALCLASVAGAQEPEGSDSGPTDTATFEEGVVEGRALALDWGFEAKTHYRDSSLLRFLSPLIPPGDFPEPGESRIFLETVNEGDHIEVSSATLLFDAAWGDGLLAHAKIDFIDLYDRNPTSTDRKIDVDEIWLRFGQDPATPVEGFRAYAKIGKFAHFERQNDRHLESYGLISTAFNRFEDAGLEVGADLGRHLYLRGSLTQGNPVFLRDPNALAGDNGTPDRDPSVRPNPVPTLKGGFPILYDAEVEDLDVDGELESGAGLGIRFGDPDAGAAVDLLVWTYRRELADTVRLEGTFYGGDLDLLNGPEGFNASLPIRGDDKQEVGANLRVALAGLSLFGQYVDQEIAGMDRSGYEAEAAWTFEMPLVGALGGRQLFPAIQPAVRYSFLKPEFAGPSPQYPAVSVRWEWVKIDYGIRLVVVSGVDLTAEFSDHTMTLANGNEISYDELLVTLRYRM